MHMSLGKSHNYVILHGVSGAGPSSIWGLTQSAISLQIKNLENKLEP